LTDDYCAGSKIAPRQTAAGWQTGPANDTVADAMRESLRRTIVYEDAGEATGGSHASPMSAVRSARAQPDEEARENVIDALRELHAARFAARAARPNRQRLARADDRGLKSMTGESRPVAEKR
jgi:hypothetical protein